MIQEIENAQVVEQCYHCGEDCNVVAIKIDEKSFCCQGCVQVYQILHAHELSDYYCLNDKPGIKIEDVNRDRFKYLDDQSLVDQLLRFKNKTQAQVELHLPQIHCSSCLWLLEHLSTINRHIIGSQVNFTTKNVTVSYEIEHLTLRQVVELLASIGYEPLIEKNVDSRSRLEKKYNSRTAYLKIGISGFCFANIMLISFPDYLGLDLGSNAHLAVFFKWVNLFLSLPVIFYCAVEFFQNAYYSFKQKYLNIDAPIALAIAVTFLRSVYEVVSDTGTGFFDSMTGIVFFMLIGRTLQNRTYTTLSFNRDFKTYFPIAVTQILDGQENVLQIQDIQEHDVIRIHHNEIIPTDALLSKGQAIVDYSFITGETEHEPIQKGEILYAGGKNMGSAIEVVAIKAFSQNSFTQLWNNQAFSKAKHVEKEMMTQVISKYFSLVIILIALGAFVYWQYLDPAMSWKAATAVLIVACPCSLLLTSTFTNGYLLETLAQKGFFLKNAQTIEALSKIDHAAFDKTGTITDSAHYKVLLSENTLNTVEFNTVIQAMKSSLHPLSQAVAQQFHQFGRDDDEWSIKEIEGQGIEVWADDHHYKIGNRLWTLGMKNSQKTEVIVTIDQKLKAIFHFEFSLREGAQEMLHRLNMPLSLISGDNDHAQAEMSKIFPRESVLKFKCKPQDKLDYIHHLQEQGRHVMMIGDGLNDAGALQQSHVGVAVVKKSFQFSPACDVIMEQSRLMFLDKLINMAKGTQRMIWMGFLYSILFNIIGISYAVTGQLSPMIAAILMPLSSWGIILIAFIGIKVLSQKNFRNINSAS